MAFAFPGLVFAFKEKFHLLFATDKISQTRQMAGFESAFRSRNGLHRKRCDRFRNALELVPAKIAEAEAIAKQPACGIGNHDRAR